MEITVTSDILWLLIGLVGLGVLVLAMIALIRINESLNIVKGMLLKNESNIDESLENIPKVLANVEEISREINGEMKNIKEAFRNIDETAEYTASAMQFVNEDILYPIKDVLSIISIIRDTIARPKKKSIFRGKK